MVNFLKLIRWPNILIINLIILGLKYLVFHHYMNAMGLMFGSAVDLTETLLLCFSVSFVAAGGYIINDIVDVDTDKINKPEKTIIGKEISVRNGYIIYVLLNLTGIAIAYYLASDIEMDGLVYIPILIAAALWIYSYYLKQSFLMGNLLIAIIGGILPPIYYICEASSFIKEYPLLINDAYGGNIHNSPVGFLFFWCIFMGGLAFIITLIREFIKDIEDIEGDKETGGQTLAIVLGAQKTKILSAILSFLFASFLSFLLFKSLNFSVFQSVIFKVYNTIFVLLPSFYLSYLIFKAETKEDYKKISSFLKLIMISGILNMLIYYILL